MGACAAQAPQRAPDRALLAATAVAAIRSGETPACSATGAATHLGGGRFVTAAHVVDGSVQRLRGNCPGGAGALVLSVAGSPAPARLLRAGQDRVDAGIGQRYVAGEDVALLQPIRPLPSLGTAVLCDAAPAASQPVLLVTPHRALRTRLLGVWTDPNPSFGSYLEIPETLQPGESGGAVLDGATGCLVGLVSHRDEGTPTRLVPASVIRRIAGP